MKSTPTILNTKPAKDWVDVDYGGVRLKSAGGIVLVGVQPQGAPIFNGVIASQSAVITGSWELRIVRDSATVVGTFRAGTDPDSAPSSIPPTLLIADRPSRGTHLYTVQVRDAGTGPPLNSVILGSASLFAYELPR